MPVIHTPPHTFMNTKTMKLEHEKPIASKIVDGKTIELWEIDFGGVWFIEVDGKEVDGYNKEDFETVKSKFEAM